jgi:DNA-binding response OmpR family regulator
MGKRILIIDDTTVLAESFADCLHMEGFEVRICRNGCDALTALKAFIPDLIITDLVMPVMDGLTFIRHYRGQHSNTRTPIIVLTADTNVEHVQEAMNAGADLLCHKPFDSDELIGRIVRLIKL